MTHEEENSMPTIERCPICDWPMADSQEKGCIPGDCSYRPDDPAEQARIARRRRELAAGISPQRASASPDDLRKEISDCWQTLEEHGFPPEASGWPFVSLIGELPNAIDCAIDCLVRQRNELDELLELRPLKLTSAAKVRRCQKCGIPTNGEEALVNGQVWCHPCADGAAELPSGILIYQVEGDEENIHVSVDGIDLVSVPVNGKRGIALLKLEATRRYSPAGTDGELVDELRSTIAKLNAEVWAWRGQVEGMAWRSLESIPKGEVVLAWWLNGEQHTGSTDGENWYPAWDHQDREWLLPQLWRPLSEPDEAIARPEIEKAIKGMTTLSCRERNFDGYPMSQAECNRRKAEQADAESARVFANDLAAAGHSSKTRCPTCGKLFKCVEAHHLVKHGTFPPHESGRHGE